MTRARKFRVGDRVVVKGVARDADEWDVGEIVRVGPNGVDVRWERANETYPETEDALELAR